MKELSKLDLSGLQSLDEGLLSEADMLEILGGQERKYSSHNKCYSFICINGSNC